jgi:hypothetical protein
MIDKKLLSSIKTKGGKVSPRAIYKGINKIRGRFGNSISKEEASYIYAAKIGIDIYKHLMDKPEELRNHVRELISSNKQVINRRDSLSKVKGYRAVKILRIKDIEIDDPLLQPKTIEDAKKMAEVYPIIYIFENSIRNFVRKAMDKAYPEGWWNEKRIPTDPFRKANSRKEEEGKNLWHGTRSSNMLDYIDLDELEKVISKNTETLTPYFKWLPKDLEWLKMKIKELYPSRNVIAHCNPLSNDDIQRVKVICRDWQKQLPRLKAKLKEE